MKNLFRIVLLMISLIYVANVSNAQWVQTGLPNSVVEALIVNDTDIFAGTNYGVFHSIDNGLNWAQLNNGLKDTGVISLAAMNDSTLVAGTISTVFISVNNGKSWVRPANDGLQCGHFDAIAIKGNTIFVGVGGLIACIYGGVYRSTDMGDYWTLVKDSGINILSLTVKDTNIFAGTDDGVYISSDNGNSWTKTSLPSFHVYTLLVNGNDIIAGTDGAGIWLSHNNGIDWTNLELHNPDYRINTFAINGTKLFAGVSRGGVFLSTNYGSNWQPVNTGLTDTFVYSLAIKSSYIFAGTFLGGIWRRPLNEFITSNKLPSMSVPSLELGQNRPNPFNNSTLMEYNLPSYGFVKLKITDITGRELLHIVNQFQPKGKYSYTFGASDFETGVYYYQLSFNNNIITKKMILIK